MLNFLKFFSIFLLPSISNALGIDCTNFACMSGTVPVSKGGTGSTATFTQGSVIFAGPSGVYNENNANFFWNNSSSFLGIGTASPGGQLDILSKTDQTDNVVKISSQNASAILWVKGNGNVGISTGTPQSTLDVNGSLQVGTGVSISTLSSTGNLQLVSGSTITTNGGTLTISTAASADVTNTKSFVMNPTGFVRLNSGIVAPNFDTIGTGILSAANLAQTPFAVAYSTTGSTGKTRQSSMYFLGVNGNALLGMQTANATTLLGPVIDLIVSSGTLASPLGPGDDSTLADLKISGIHNKFFDPNGSTLRSIGRITVNLDSVDVSTAPGTSTLPTYMGFHIAPKGTTAAAEAVRVTSNKSLSIGDFGTGTSDAAMLVVKSSGSASVPVIIRDNSGNNLVNITNQGGVGLYSRTLAQLQSLAPTAAGEVYYCSNCSPAKVVVATGTSAGNFADAAGGTFK